MPVTGMAIARTAATMLLMTGATAAGAPFESSTPATPTAVSAAIGTPAPAAAIPSSASKRSLEARAGIAAANTRGLPREFRKPFERSAGVCHACAGFAGK